MRWRIDGGSMRRQYSSWGGGRYGEKHVSDDGLYLACRKRGFNTRNIVGRQNEDCIV